MNVFDDIRISWGGKEYFIPANKVLPALARVEEFLTLHELHQFQERGTVPIVRLSQAFASVLRFAGARVADEEVYREIVGGKSDVGQTITSLLLMMIPHDLQDVPQETGSGNPRPAEVRSSRKRTRPRSAN